MDPITATYAHDDADWTITVSGLGKELTDRAPGIIAARDRADQLVEKVAPEHGGRTVVHLLNGSAFDFTAAYIEARLTTSSGGSAPADGATSGKASTGKTAAAKPATPKTPAPKSETTPADNAKASEQKEPAVATASAS